MKLLLTLFLFASLMIYASGCYYDKEEDLYLGSGSCDTTNITYSASVAPVFASYCNSCHGGGSPSGGIITNNYASVKSNITRIRGAINHQQGFLAMPQNGGQLSGCDLTKIDIWIRMGMPNN